MIDYTSLKLSGSGVKIRETLENDVKSLITKISDKKMDYLTEIVKAANAEKTGVEISFNDIKAADLPDKEILMTLLAQVRSCDGTGIINAEGNEMDGEALADAIEKMIKELDKMKDDYMIVFGKEPSLYRIFHTDGDGFHDRPFTVYEKQAERIEAQLVIEREDLIYEQLKLVEGIDSDKKRERCEGNISTQKEIISDLENELFTVIAFGELRMGILKAQRDLRWERAKENPDAKKIRDYKRLIDRLHAEKSREKYKEYTWSYINDELSETAEGNEKAMRRFPAPEHENLPYVDYMLDKQRDFNVMAVAAARLEESINEWNDNEKMKAAKKEETEQALEVNFAKAEREIREALKILRDNNELLLWQYHEAVKTGNTEVEDKFLLYGAGKASPKLHGAEEIQKLAEQLSMQKAEDELPAIEQPAETDETIYIEETGGEQIPAVSGVELVHSLKTELKLPDVHQAMFEFDESSKQNILRNLLKTAQIEYNRQDYEDYIRSYAEKSKEIRDNVN